MADQPTAGHEDLAARLHRWLEADGRGSTAAGLIAEAAAALRDAGRQLRALEDELGHSRHVTYKEVLARRGQSQRADGTPLWPLRPDVTVVAPPPKWRAGAVPDPAPAGLQQGDDLPDWMR